MLSTFPANLWKLGNTAQKYFSVNVSAICMSIYYDYIKNIMSINIINLLGYKYVT